MADSEDDYSSSDDSDYVPEGGSESESDEDLQEENKDGEREEGKKKKPKKDATVNRKRKGGIKLEDEEDIKDVDLDEDEEKELQEERKMLEEERLKAKEAEEEEKEKKKADDLWKSFLSDVGQRPKPSSSKTEVSSKPSERTSQENKREVEKRPPTENSEKASSNQGTVTVTKVFDFAGEEVKVSENVKVDSQEAKAILQKADKPSTNLTPSQPPLGIKRKPGGVGSLLGKLNKKPKMSVLEKSKLDWDTFKRKEGIEEDLKIHNKGKDGFLQKQDFLMETDLRQYEVERKLRMGQSGR